MENKSNITISFFAENTVGRGNPAMHFAAALPQTNAGAFTNSAESLLAQGLRIMWKILNYE